MAEETKKQEFQKRAEKTTWWWSDRNATLLWCIEQKRLDGYDLSISFTATNRYHPTITIERDKKPLYSWSGHEYSVFHIKSNTLYYASFWQNSGPITTIVAVDLTNGTELWRMPTKGVSKRATFSAYRIRCILDVNVESGVISIWGNESDGRYYELKDIRTGKTVGHKAFPTEEALPNKELKAPSNTSP